MLRGWRSVLRQKKLNSFLIFIFNSSLICDFLYVFIENYSEIEVKRNVLTFPIRDNFNLFLFSNASFKFVDTSLIVSL